MMSETRLKRIFALLLFCAAFCLWPEASSARYLQNSHLTLYVQRPENGATYEDAEFVEEYTIDDEWDDDWDDFEEPEPVHDPFVKYNRFMFNVNDTIYRRVLDPFATVYDFVIPKKVQGSINNFTRFASTPKRFFNNLLQRKPKSALIEFERLLINASVGIGGLFDPADAFFKLDQQSEDFGQTLGVYGYKEGPYVIIPLLGPSTGRDIIGMGVDRAFSPFMWLSNYDVDPDEAFSIIKHVRRANKYPYKLRSRYRRLVEDAIDPYGALQDFYIQDRKKEIAE